MASVIEKEVGQASERPLVAGVFVNRLAKSMPLATDPTVIYAALLDNRWRGTIYASDLQSPSPYNTYKHTGLPPGPIANPGIASLPAALHPAQTDYLYFVSDAAGHTRFSVVSERARRAGAGVPPGRKALTFNVRNGNLYTNSHETVSFLHQTLRSVVERQHIQHYTKP